MKNAKKLASIMLAIVMVLAMAIPAFAEETTVFDQGPASGSSPATKGSITIDNALYNKTYKIYKILELESYNRDPEAYSYKFTDASAWKEFFTTYTADGDAATNYVDVAAKDANGNYYVTWKKDADVAAFAKLAQKYAVAKNLTADGSKSVAKDKPAVGETTTIKFENLELGYYLLDTDLGTLCSLDSTDANVIIKEKNAEPTNEKKVEEDSTNQYGAKNDADIGQTVNFKSTIVAQAGAQKYVFHDKMDAGLTFSGAVTVTKNGTKVEAAGNYELKTTGFAEGDDCTFEVVFTDAFCDGLAKDDEIIISYSAVLNENAEINSANVNESKITYGENGKFKTETSTTETYTWSFDVYKYTEKDGNKVALSGAKFTLKNKTDNTQYKFIKVTDGSASDPAVADVYRIAVKVNETDYEAGALDDITTNASGKFTIQGLDADEYLLTETEAPAGYNKLADPIKVVITADKTAETVTSTVTAASLKADNSEVPVVVGNDGVEILNQTGAELPSTGGIGTTIFYIVGSIMLIGAAVLLISKRRMSTAK